eukprot:16843-Heterococcus_DN1.PRE.2
MHCNVSRSSSAAAKGSMAKLEKDIPPNSRVSMTNGVDISQVARMLEEQEGGGSGGTAALSLSATRSMQL